MLQYRNLVGGEVKSLRPSSMGTACSLFMQNREMKLLFWD